jgi:hypothetical protein
MNDGNCWVLVDRRGMGIRHCIVFTCSLAPAVCSVCLIVLCVVALVFLDNTAGVPGTKCPAVAHIFGQQH